MCRARRHVTQRRQHHRHLRRHGVVAGGLGVLEDGAVLVAEHRTGASRRFLRHAHQAGSPHFAAIGVNGRVFEAPGSHCVAWHHVLHPRAIVCQRGSDLVGRHGAQWRAGLEAAPPHRVHWQQGEDGATKRCAQSENKVRVQRRERHWAVVNHPDHHRSASNGPQGPLHFVVFRFAHLHS